MGKNEIIKLEGRSEEVRDKEREREGEHFCEKVINSVKFGDEEKKEDSYSWLWNAGHYIYIFIYFYL